MKIQDNLHLGAEAREGLMKGVRKAAEAVAITLGTAGSNSLIETIASPRHMTTNDGITVLENIHFSDPLEEMGRMVLFEAVSRANKQSGDGSSTATVLTAAILEEGIKHLDEATPMEIKRSLEACIPLIEKSLNEQKKEVTVDNLKDVASISAEDEGIGSMIQEIYQKIGKDGIITWEASKTATDSYTIGTGIKIDGATYASRYMCDAEGNNFTNKATITNPYILLAKKKITSTTEVDDLMQTLWQQEIKEVVIFCDEIDPPVINAFLQARAQIGFRVVVVKMPVLWNDEWWEDLEVATGGTIVGGLSGLKFKNVEIKHLGKVEKITVNKEDTVLEGVQGMVAHIANLQAEGTDQSLIRAARLNTRTARYFVGGHSESSLAYRRLKVEDAINAATIALQNGVVVGGGIALLNVSGALSEERNGIGATILKDSLLKPFDQILTNAGADSDSVFKKLGGRMTVGFNSRTGKVEDLMAAGIVDPTDVVFNAIKNAIGVAAGILTIGSVITLPREENQSSNQTVKM